MLVQQDARRFDITGATEVLEADVELSAHLFEMLSNMYSDTKWAIVREYGTNMYDGHLKLGLAHATRPPIIHLPTAFEPWIEFKDFGSGMSDVEVRTVFRKYGASTKRKSNDLVGGMGLGAKVAFAYRNADQWTFDSRFNGKRYIWACARTEEGIPAYIPLDTVPTSEPNGVTIRIPVAQSDFEAFRVAVVRLLQTFPIEVQVVGVSNFELPAANIDFEGTNWDLRRSGDTCVVMGNVPYPIKDTLLREVFNVYNLHGRLGGASNLVVRMPIGALAVTPAREALNYDDRTTARLRGALNAVRQEMCDVVERNLQSAPSRWAAMGQLDRMRANPWLHDLVRDPLYKGAKLNALEGVKKRRDEAEAAGVSVVDVYNPANSAAGVERENEREPLVRLSLSPNAAIVRDDLPATDTTGAARLRYWIREHCTEPSKHRRKESRRVKDGAGTLVHVRTQLTDEALSEYFEGVPVLQLSDLPEPPPVVRAPSKPRAPTVIKRLVPSSYRSADWEAYGVVPTDVKQALYVRLQGDEPIGGSIDDVRRIRDAIDTLDLYPTDTPRMTFGIPRTCRAAERTPGWVDLLGDPLRTRIAAALLAERDDISRHLAFSAITAPMDNYLAQLLAHNDFAGTALADAAVFFARAYDARTRASALVKCAHVLVCELPAAAPLPVNFQQLMDTYPVVGLLSRLAQNTDSSSATNMLSRITYDDASSAVVLAELRSK